MFRQAIKRWKYVLILAVVFAILPRLQTQAQGSSDAPIILNDQTPSIDAAIQTNNGASGAVSIELQNAQIRLTDDKNVQALSVADPRITMVIIQLAEGAQAETLHVERLPGVQVAQVKITAQTALPDTNVSTSPTPISMLNQPVLAKLAIDPALSLPVTTTTANNLVRAEFSQGQQTIQLVDIKGVVLFNALTGNQINGIALRVSPGDYSLKVANDDKAATAEMLVALGSVTPTTLADLPQPTSVPLVAKYSPGGESCTASVNVSAANLRSGPGTGYTTTGFVTQNSSVSVGGQNHEGNWTLVQSGGTSAWVSTSAITLSGGCGKLTSYDIATRDLTLQAPSIANQPAPRVVVPAPNDHSKPELTDKTEPQQPSSQPEQPEKPQSEQPQGD